MWARTLARVVASMVRPIPNHGCLLAAWASNKVAHGCGGKHGRGGGAGRRYCARHYARRADERASADKQRIGRALAISRPTASEHLTKLVNARLLNVTQKRRNRYYRIASPLVARMLEGLKAVAALETPARYQPRSAQDDALRFARICYDHLAGRLGVVIADALVAKRCLVLSEDGGEVTARGKTFLIKFGAELAPRAGKPANLLPRLS
jgi:DNA-binding transcriptional ArsR family regulator